MTTQISERGAQRLARTVAPVSDRAAVTTVEPVPRIALTQQEACASLGCSEEFFVEHVRPYLRAVRAGALPGGRAAMGVDEMAENVREPHGRYRHQERIPSGLWRKAPE